MSTTKADAVYVVVERGGPHTRTEIIANNFDFDFTSPLASLTNNNLTVTSQPNKVVMGIAVDATNNLVWFYNPWYGGWNYGQLDGTVPVSPTWGGSQNPSTSVGGWTMQTCAGFTPGQPIFPIFYLNTTSGIDVSLTFNFGATPFRYPIPAGYSAWGVGVTLDPGNTGTAIILSGGNLTATNNGTLNAGAQSGTVPTAGYATGKHYMEFTVNAMAVNGTYNPLLIAMSNGNRGALLFQYPAIAAFGGYTNLLNTPVVGFNFNFQLDGSFPHWDMRTTMTVQGASSGKYYWEITLNNLDNFGGDASPRALVGLANHFQLLSTTAIGGGGFIGDLSGNGIGWGSDGGVHYLDIGLGGGAGTYHTGSTLGIAVDFDNHLVWFWNPEVSFGGQTGLWNNDVLANQDPSAAIGGYSFAGMVYPAFPAASVAFWVTSGTPNDILTGNWGQNPFVYPAPTGFGTFFATRALTTPPGFTIERMDNRIWPTVENCWCVDCGFTLEQPTPPADLTISAV